jgi:pimeloyl-ACP methyl ester carboxylesterase
MWILALIGLAILWTPDLDWASLEAEYLRDPKDIARVGDVRWHVRDEGAPHEGVIVLIHGFASDLQTWNAWASVLQTRYRVIRFDLPGYALSGPVAGGDYRSATQCLRIEALLRSRGVDPKASSVPLIWAGHSMGAGLATQCAASSAHPPHGLILVAPALTAATSGSSSDEDRARATGSWSQALKWILPKQLVRQGLTSAHAAERPPSDDEVNRSYAMLRAPGVRQAILDSAAQRGASVDQAAQFQGPVLVLWGDQERLLRPGVLATVQQAFPQAQVRRYPQAGHMVHEDAAEASLADVRAFLRERLGSY